ncbi:PTS ascorbate transporter subunit IIC [Bacillus sp. SIMBA_031]|uniref:PTS ascorbate transporter subunit IIC n=1 Tax=Bacillus sp. SIMBA_031 TaxID=3085774 RepID=UPI00397D8418
MNNLSGVFDWSFFWGIFAMFLKLAGPFVMLVVAIIAVGLLILAIVRAVKAKG